MPENAVLPRGSLVNGRYRVLNLIGGGAMSYVYKVEHTGLGTFHALKEQSEVSRDEHSLLKTAPEVAQREARILTGLAHPNLPRVSDFFRENNKAYLVMDYIEGVNLKSILDSSQGQPLDVLSVVRWGIQVSQILSYLHSQNPPIIFRDIKPANLILRQDETVVLVDFGIARQVRPDANIDTIVFGSPGYAPPEQYGKGQTDPRSDLYALGATLHHLLTGRDPSHSPFRWPPLRFLNPLVPTPLDKIVRQCVELEKGHRPPTAEAVSSALRALLPMLEREPHVPFEGVIRVRARSNRLELPEDGEGFVENWSAGRAVVSDAGPQTVMLRPGEAPEESDYPREYGVALPEPELFRPVRPASPASATATAVAEPATVVEASPSDSRRLSIIYTREGSDPRSATQRLAGVVRSGTDALEENRRAARVLYRCVAVCALLVVAGGLLLPFQRIGTLRLTLDALMCVGLLGALVPLRPTRAGIMLAIGGVLSLLCLTATFCLPAKSLLFVPIALLEILSLLPLLMLLPSRDEKNIITTETAPAV